jgi:hypothetical protein
MNKYFRFILVAAIALAASWGQVARADVDNASATNVQEGDNDTSTEQSGNADSGDAVAGQVAGVVSSGDASVDATNRSEDVDVSTGDADAFNTSDSFVGLTAGTATTLGAAIADIINDAAVNVQEGDNEYELTQDASATSGDGVGGQVLGVVTSAGGSADVVAANTSEDVDIDTGDVDADNDANAFVGLNAFGDVLFDGVGGGAGASPTATAADIDNIAAFNVQEGDNDAEAAQDASAASGDGVGGSVIGVVSAGDASVDATNHSEDVDISTGDADASNDFDAFVGLTEGDTIFFDAIDGGAGAPGASPTAVASDIVNDFAFNVQEGDNDKSLTQDASATSGDGVAGQVAGVVTSAGGSADLVLANTSLDSDADTGDGTFDNTDDSFTGLNAFGLILL